MNKMVKTTGVFLAAILILVVTASTVFPAAHLRDLKFRELNDQPPDGNDYRPVLK